MVLLASFWVVLATYLQTARFRGVSLFDRLWAEDGSVFLEHALRNAWLPSLLEPYARYMNFLPRLMAEIASVSPLRLAPVVMSVGSAILVSLLSVFVFLASGEILRSRTTRAMLAGLMIVLPAALETTGNASNLHWYFLFACFWALIDSQRHWGRAWVGSLVALGATMSSPLSALLLPMAVFRLVRADRKEARAVPIAFFAGLVVQASVVLAESTGAPSSEAVLSDLLRLFGLRVAGSLLVGERFLDSFWRLFGWGFAYAALGIMLGVGVALWRRDSGQRGVAVAAFMYSILFFFVTLWFRGTSWMLPTTETANVGASRYTVVPILLLAAITLMLIEAPDSTTPSRWGLRLRYGVLGLFFAVVVANYSADAPATPEPRWNTELEMARRTCATEGLTQVDIPVAPGHPWAVLTACDRLVVPS
jgi:hypothetical protein